MLGRCVGAIDDVNYRGRKGVGQKQPTRREILLLFGVLDPGNISGHGRIGTDSGQCILVAIV